MPSEAYELLEPLARSWLNRIDAAIRHKKTCFGDFAEQCMGFFAGAVGFMYDPKFQAKYIGGSFSPRFKVTLNKAFEVVAILGPLIYSRNPVRYAEPPERVDYGPEVFGDPADPQVQAIHQQAVAKDRQRRGVLKSGCQALERYLNYTPDQQPNGGLKQASQDACTEGLVKGRGVLWSEAYQLPGSNRILTGNFYDTVDRLLVDPDAESANFGEAYWIARQCVEPHWKAERDRDLPYGSLRNKGNQESSEAQSSRRANLQGARMHDQGRTFDTTRYWKIWSIGGVGTRLTGTSKTMQQAFDEVVGDYAYIEVARGVNWPLNMAKERFLTATDEEVQEAFSWPVPYWKAQKWPCAMLDFYRQPNCSWPISPLRPGLGELVALNIIISRLTSHIYHNTRTVTFVLKSAMKDVELALKSNDDDPVVGVPEILKDIDSIVKSIQGPAVNYDVWRIIDHLFNLFDKRVGLTELMFGLNPGAASRISADAETKQQQIAVRPDYMAGRVEEWQKEVVENEKLCAYFSGVNGETVRPLVGDVGAYIFDQTFAQAPEDTVIHEMTCSIAAGSIRKPNRQRDAANLKEVYQPLSIQLGQYAQQTGDFTKLDELNQRLGEAMEVDMDGLTIGQLPPPQPPEAQGPPPPDPAQEAKAENMRQDMAMQGARQTQQMQISAAEHQQHIRQQGEAHAADMMLKIAKARLARMGGNGRGGKEIVKSRKR